MQLAGICGMHDAPNPVPQYVLYAHMLWEEAL